MFVAQAAASSQLAISSKTGKVDTASLATPTSTSTYPIKLIVHQLITHVFVIQNKKHSLETSGPEFPLSGIYCFVFFTRKICPKSLWS